MVKDLLVLGGGNAGLMAALYLKAAYPEMNITVVKSDKIGTIGVGEGSTEHWTAFAAATGILNREIINLINRSSTTTRYTSKENLFFYSTNRGSI